MGEPLRLGIAGFGNAGSAVWHDLKSMTDVVLSAAADLRGDAFEPLRQNNRAVRTFGSVEEMCAWRGVDAIWIATPNEFHAAHAIAAAQNGKHLVCEKPMALSLAECDRMIEAAEKNRVRLLMHSKASDPPVAKMGEVVASGRLGRVIQISTWNYKGWLRSPRLPSEVDSARGGGVVYRQGPHQVDIVRWIGGGMVRSVRARTGKWHPRLDTEGNFSAFLEFDDGTPACLVFNGYGFFDITEWTWGIGEGGTEVSRRPRPGSSAGGPVDEAQRYSGLNRSERARRQGARKQPFYGLTLVSCEKGDMRQSPEGLYLYTEEGREEVACPPYLGRGAELLELYEAVTRDRPVFTDGRWGMATLEVILAILESSRQGREIFLSHQVPSRL